MNTGSGKKKNSLAALLMAATGGAIVSAMMVAGASATGTQPPRLLQHPSTYQAQISFADLVESVSPAVVSIHTESNVTETSLPPDLENMFRYRFGGQLPEQMPQQRSQQAEGSGFFIDAKGHVVTNNHVVKGAEKITVRLNDGSELPATIVGVDAGTDLAVLKVDPAPGQKFVRFADDVNLRVGDWVVAVGNPFGLGGTVTSGIVSALGRDNYSLGSYSDYIQIDAPINRGNSGGPTFDLQGRVVGVNTAIYSPTGGSVGIGFAIPATTASYVVNQIIENGSVSRGWLGVSIRDVDSNLAMALQLKNTKGALVADVIDGTPAAKAGFKSGDVVLEFDDTPIDDARDLTRSVGAVEPGKSVKLKVARDGSVKNLIVKLGERSDEEATVIPASAPGEKSTTEKLGVRFEALSDDMRHELGLPSSLSGVAVTGVAPGSPGAEAGLKVGTVILEADNRPVQSARDVEEAIDAAKEDGREAILLRIQIGDRRDFRALPLADKEE